jgi:hypothetical protein
LELIEGKPLPVNANSPCIRGVGIMIGEVNPVPDCAFLQMVLLGEYLCAVEAELPSPLLHEVDGDPGVQGAVPHETVKVSPSTFAPTHDERKAKLLALLLKVCEIDGVVIDVAGEPTDGAIQSDGNNTKT